MAMRRTYTVTIVQTEDAASVQITNETGNIVSTQVEVEWADALLTAAADMAGDYAAHPDV